MGMVEFMKISGVVHGGTQNGHWFSLPQPHHIRHRLGRGPGLLTHLAARWQREGRAYELVGLQGGRWSA